MKGSHYGERSLLADVIPLDAPYSLICETSQVCNIKCNYCMQSFIKRDHRQIMSLSTFGELCEQIGEFGKIKKVNLAGWGEPLVNKELPNMVQHLSQMNIVENIDIVTNGLLLTRILSEKLISAGTDYIRISLQGMTSEKYEEICGKKIDFQDFVDNIRFLYENKGDCQIYVKICDIALSPGEEELFYKTFEDITDRMLIETIRPMFQENKQDGRTVSKFGIDHPPVMVCPTPFYMLDILATGEITACCSYYRPNCLGTIYNASLKNVWNGEEMQKLRMMLLDGNRQEQSEYPVCKNCLMADAILTPGDFLDDRADEIRRKF